MSEPPFLSQFQCLCRDAAPRNVSVEAWFCNHAMRCALAAAALKRGERPVALIGPGGAIFGYTLGTPATAKERVERTLRQRGPAAGAVSMQWVRETAADFALATLLRPAPSDPAWDSELASFKREADARFLRGIGIEP